MKKVWLVWGVGVFAYVIAVLHRTSFGVSGLSAADRFSISPSVLSSFVVLQIVVYAGMQIPAGVLLDRYGSRIMIAVGAFIMMSAQLALAFTEIAARRDRCTYCRRCRGCTHLHLGVAVGTAVVPAPAGAVGLAVHGHPRSAGPGDVCASVHVAVVRTGLDFCLRQRCRCRTVGVCAGVECHPRRASRCRRGRRAGRRQGDRATDQDGVDAARHPTRVLQPHGDSVLDHDVRAAVGCAVPEIGSRPRLHDGRLAADAVSHLGNRGRPRSSVFSPVAIPCVDRGWFSPSWWPARSCGRSCFRVVNRLRSGC